MDMSSKMGGEASGKAQAQPSALEYAAQAVSPVVSGEVKLTIAENSFTAAAVFDIVEVPFSEISEVAFADYVVTVRTDHGDYVFSRMGQWAQPFYDALCDAYNKAVLRSMFVGGAPILTARGEYLYSENIATVPQADSAAHAQKVTGKAPVNVYYNCVAVLPPDLSARRVPLCFVTGIDKGGYEITLKLDMGESYTFAKMGYETDLFANAVEKQIRALREESLAAIKILDPSLSPPQASQIMKLMPQGAAAAFGQLAEIAPSFVEALEAKLKSSRAAPYYTALKEICDPAKIYVGFRKNETGADIGAGVGLSGIADMAGMTGGMTGGGNTLEAFSDSARAGADNTGTETAQPDPYLIWLIAPSPDGRLAIVEFAQADAATFIYRSAGGFDNFAKQLNRALEAISFKREVIRLSDEELRKPENADYFMAATRTASLQLVRSSFVDRVIHSSPETWKAKLTEMWN